MSKGAIGSILVLTAAAVAVFVSGCGGGDSTTAVSKAQYVKKVNAFCREKEEERFGDLMAKGQKLEEKARGKAISNKEKEDILVSVLPSYEKMVTELREMDVPEGDEDQLEAIYDAMDQAAQKIKANPGTALVSEVPFVASEKLAKAYGLECGF